MIRTIDVSNEDICQLRCYREPNCVSYNFNKKNEKNGRHKCDLNNASYEHDNDHSGDLAKNENYVYREAEVSIQPVKICNLYGKAFHGDYVWQSQPFNKAGKIEVLYPLSWIEHLKDGFSHFGIF